MGRLSWRVSIGAVGPRPESVRVESCSDSSTAQGVPLLRALDRTWRRRGRQEPSNAAVGLCAGDRCTVATGGSSSDGVPLGAPGDGQGSPPPASQAVMARETGRRRARPSFPQSSPPGASRSFSSSRLTCSKSSGDTIAAGLPPRERRSVGSRDAPKRRLHDNSRQWYRVIRDPSAMFGADFLVGRPCLRISAKCAACAPTSMQISEQSSRDRARG